MVRVSVGVDRLQFEESNAKPISGMFWLLLGTGAILFWATLGAERVGPVGVIVAAVIGGAMIISGLGSLLARQSLVIDREAGTVTFKVGAIFSRTRTWRLAQFNTVRIAQGIIDGGRYEGRTIVYPISLMGLGTKEQIYIPRRYGQAREIAAEICKFLNFDFLDGTADNPVPMPASEVGKTLQQRHAEQQAANQQVSSPQASPAETPAPATVYATGEASVPTARGEPVIRTAGVARSSGDPGPPPTGHAFRVERQGRALRLDFRAPGIRRAFQFPVLLAFIMMLITAVVIGGIIVLGKLSEDEPLTWDDVWFPLLGIAGFFGAFGYLFGLLLFELPTMFVRTSVTADATGLQISQRGLISRGEKTIAACDLLELRTGLLDVQAVTKSGPISLGANCRTKVEMEWVRDAVQHALVS